MWNQLSGNTRALIVSQGKTGGEGPVEPVSSDQQPIQAVGSYSNF
jgi:hypothetical protein